MATKRKISIRKILQLLLTVIVTTGCVIAMVSAARTEDVQVVKGVQVHIKNAKKYHLIEERQIMDEAINSRNVDLQHIPMARLDIHGIEQAIEADPWVADAQVFVDNGHTMHIYVTQRIPVVRLFEQNSNSYYLDARLNAMPLSKVNVYYTSIVTNVPRLSNDSASNSIKRQIVLLTRRLQADSFWNAQVSQVIMDSVGCFELVPVLGNQKIIFGDTSRMNDKLGNLMAFYKNVLNRIGWDKYETLDLRYKGQVVASPSLPYKGPVDKAVVNMNWVNSIMETEARREQADSVRTGHAPVRIAPLPVSAPKAIIKKPEPKKPAPKKPEPKKPAAKKPGPAPKKPAPEAKKKPAADSKEKNTKTEKPKVPGNVHKPGNTAKDQPKYTYPETR